jgi:molybdenum cofactor synthesis domain-containing protein
MSEKADVTAAVLVIGNEILSGRTQDVNINFLAVELTKLGIVLKEARVIADDRAAIIATVNELRGRYTYVFTTGGIGPTHDDITAACVAEAFGTSLHRDPAAVALLESHYAPGDLTEARLKMAEVPVGASLIDNPVSKAPGFRLGNVHVLAGVPRIAHAMFDAIRPTLTPGAEIFSVTVSCGLGEGVIADGLSAVQNRFPQVSVGSYPYFRMGQMGTSLVARGTDRAAVGACAEAIRSMVVGLGGTAQVTTTA